LRSVTIRQCAVLVGGLGTRLGALTADTPKPVLPCGDRPFLAWLLRELARYGVQEAVLLTGHLSERLEAAVADFAGALPRQMRIEFAPEPIRAGTGGALFHARERLDDRFLLLNGDSLFDFNLANLLAEAASDEAEGVAGRMVLRELEDASRFGVVTLQAGRVTAFHERPPEGAPAGTINAGIYVFGRALLGWLEPACSLERDVLPRWGAAISATSACRTISPRRRPRCRRCCTGARCSWTATG